MLTPRDPLPISLRRLVFYLEQGTVPPRYADRLASDVDATLRALGRDRALLALFALLSSEQSDWATAGVTVAALNRFQVTAWPRIQTGHREARTEMERLFLRVLEGGEPPGQRYIWNLLREHRKLNDRVQKSVISMDANVSNL